MAHRFDAGCPLVALSGAEREEVLEIRLQRPTREESHDIRLYTKDRNGVATGSGHAYYIPVSVFTSMFKFLEAVVASLPSGFDGSCWETRAEAQAATSQSLA